MSRNPPPHVAVVLWLLALALPLWGQATAIEIPGYNAGAQLHVGLMGLDPATGLIVLAGNGASGPMTWMVDPSSPAAPSPLPLPYPATGTTEVSGISPNGRWIVGNVQNVDFNGNLVSSQGILWDRLLGGYSLAPSPPSTCQSLGLVHFAAVSDTGLCLGQSYWIPAQVMTWSVSSGWTLIPGYPTSPSTSCFLGRSGDLSADGSVAVGSLWATGAYGTAVQWNPLNGAPLLLPATNADSDAVAVSPSGRLVAGRMKNAAPSSYHRAALWIDGVPFVIEEPPGSTAYKMNVWDVVDSGFVCGRSAWASPFTPFIWRVGWERSQRPEDWLTNEIGLSIPVPGGSGAFEQVREILAMVDDGSQLHLIVWTTSSFQTRSYLVSVPIGSNPAVGAGTDLLGQTWLAVSNLAPGTDMTTVFSTDTSAALGTGPYLGLHAQNVNDLLWQALLPTNTPPFRFVATSPTELFGPYALPSGFLMDLLSIEGAWPNFGDVSEVSRHLVP